MKSKMYFGKIDEGRVASRQPRERYFLCCKYLLPDPIVPIFETIKLCIQNPQAAGQRAGGRHD